MKKILLILSLILNFLYADIKDTFPKLEGRVIDQVNLLSSETKNELEKILKDEEEKTSNQIVVVILKSLNGYAIEEYTLELGRYWGIGQKEKNNGVLLFVSMEEKKIRIEVGYGLEGALTDAISKEIIEYTIMPSFKEKQYDLGILKAVNEIRSAIQGEFVANNKNGGGYWSIFNIYIPLGLFVLFFVSYFLNSYSHKIKNLFLYRVTFSIFVSSVITFIIYVFAPVIIFFSEPFIEFILSLFFTTHLSISSFFIFIISFIFFFINSKDYKFSEDQDEIYKNSSENKYKETYNFKENEIKSTTISSSYSSEKNEEKSTSSYSSKDDNSDNSSSSNSGFFGKGGSFGGGGASGSW